MPRLTPKVFFKTVSKPSRWCFTAWEVNQPQRCLASDEFIAYAPDELTQGVVVLRDGTVTDRWEDGSTGVPPRARSLARACEELYKPTYFETRNLAQNEQDELADIWRDVLTNSQGHFLRFTDSRRDEAVSEVQAETFMQCVLEGRAREFVNSLFPSYRVITDLKALGWRLAGVWQHSKHYKLQLTGFYGLSQRAEADVTLECAIHREDLLSLVLYDHVVWQNPIGVYTVRWSAVRPVMLIWHKTLPLEPPEAATDRRLIFTDWKKNWHQLDADLKARQEQEQLPPAEP